jgi:hypothetical protein
MIGAGTMCAERRAVHPCPPIFRGGWPGISNRFHGGHGRTPGHLSMHVHVREIFFENNSVGKMGGQGGQQRQSQGNQGVTCPLAWPCSQKEGGQ